ncbi:hypothetical protein PC9H_008206 [Pleurotus ostreatus]|uniref:G-alpha-domain-containing protein n=1 Tax=Pleurotus ostreatus TaxID=5322 RepID=A0A8H6ZVN3_PLEOS|nr:uncharacterized protein PC9H_008206 [Pleurotus ostreatus]KAF7428969.1 hypothetical protein PC9H_008206 [Pleurotus ostreatus]KAJ8697239.1 hypothetical protein PTI98_007037 [Pleurotus ostreatus]
MVKDDYDPLAIVMAPPAKETPEERALREQKEVEAKQVSDKIDEAIRLERVALRKQKNILRVLLLGQAESGKSTTLKNFCLKYAYQQWIQERTSWRAVIQLNLIRSFITILDTIQAEINHEPVIDPGGSDDDDDEETDAVIEPPVAAVSAAPKVTPTILNEAHQILALRLAPIRQLEGTLKRRLGIMADEVHNAPPEEMRATPFDPPTVPTTAQRRRELMVRCWSDALKSNLSGGRRESDKSRDGTDKVTDVLASCRQDLLAMWRDANVRKVLKKRHITLEESTGFFLDDLERIATNDYEPTDDDVVRARLRTLGVQEHRILFEQGAIPTFSIGHEFGKEWMIYDVGGSRTMRHAWLPYFDNVNAVIFLAPVSCFDERLDEDPSINRLEDSFILWKAVVSTPLLQKATMIVFLNKCDLLKKKIKRGVQVNKHMPSYGERPNEASSVVKYLRDKFKDMLKQFSPEPRIGYLYPTSVTDTKATSATLKSVRDGILREHLKNANFV